MGSRVFPFRRDNRLTDVSGEVDEGADRVRVSDGPALRRWGSQSHKDGGPYQWSPTITVPGTSMPGMVQRWDARVDFADLSKPLKPLTALEELCQAVLLSPEFAVME